MDIDGLRDFRDRRIAAADEERDHAGVPRDIFGDGTAAHRAVEAGHEVDLTRMAFDREPDRIRKIVLHCTSGPEFTVDDLPAVDEDVVIGSHAYVDSIIAHFLVFNDGTTVYTHDVQRTLNDAGGGRGIDIEFTGRFSFAATPPADAADRLDPRAIRAGRRLLRRLKELIPTIVNIHPHGQVQTHGTGKRDSCPGPDVWVNVGEWAVTELGLSTTSGDLVISPAQTNPAYRQDVAGE